MEKWRKHYIPAAVSGRVVAINKQVGDSIRPGETILQIQDTRHLQVEGFMEHQKLGVIRDNMPVLVQPTIKRSPTLTVPLTKSSKPITAIATTKVGEDNLVVVGGEDGWAYA